MSTPLHPITDVVSQAWLQLAAPGVHVDDELPTVQNYPALRTVGAIRTVTIPGGGPEADVPMRHPVVTAECWVAPSEVTAKTTWNRAGQLAGRLVAATYEPALMAVRLELPGEYADVRVHTVIALTEPTRVDEKSGWARLDLDLLFSWSVA